VGSRRPTYGDGLTTYLLDSTVLIAHLRGDVAATEGLLALLGEGHSLATTCVSVAEVERGLRPKERRAAKALVDRLGFLTTTREAATRAGRYQADWSRRGRTITPDALIAGTARAHGAVLATDSVGDFPMRDIVVKRFPPSDDGTP
jgi:predicted nucleic acid-binding protein